MTPLSKIAELEAWIERRRREAGLRELAFYPGSDREISMDDAASVAMDLLHGFDAGEEPHEP
jgi:hypothetical protein